jgi:glutaredoxin
MKVEIYVTNGCPYCQKLMAWLEKFKVKHEKTVFADSTAKMAFYKANPGVSTVPQIFLDGIRVGGWSDFQTHPFKKQTEQQ